MDCKTLVWILPLILLLWIPLTFFTTYGMAVKNGHVAAYWPYLSDTGTFAPESCIFGQLLNLAAFLLVIIVYVRYRQVKIWSEVLRSRISPRANTASLVLGMISCFGLDMVANFQETNLKTGHFLGAFLCFIPGTIYSIMQMIFTRQINENAKGLFAFRITMAICSVVATIGYIAPTAFALKAFHGSDKLQWKPNDGGYGLHILSTSMEWITVFAYVFIMSSLYFDFRNLRISAPVVEVMNLRDRNGKSIKQNIQLV